MVSGFSIRATNAGARIAGGQAREIGPRDEEAVLCGRHYRIALLTEYGFVCSPACTRQAIVADDRIGNATLVAIDSWRPPYEHPPGIEPGYLRSERVAETNSGFEEQR